MAYISNYLPQHLYPLKPHLLTPEDEIKLNEEKKKKEIKFRNASDVKIEKKPCPCMANKIKPPESS